MNIVRSLLHQLDPFTDIVSHDEHNSSKTEDELEIPYIDSLTE